MTPKDINLTTINGGLKNVPKYSAPGLPGGSIVSWNDMVVFFNDNIQYHGRLTKDCDKRIHCDRAMWVHTVGEGEMPTAFKSFMDKFHMVLRNAAVDGRIGVYHRQKAMANDTGCVELPDTFEFSPRGYCFSKYEMLRLLDEYVKNRKQADEFFSLGAGQFRAFLVECCDSVVDYKQAANMTVINAPVDHKALADQAIKKTG